MFVYLSIGTNIQPEKNAVNITRELCQNFGPIILYPFIYTQPISMPNTALFLNALATIRTDAPTTEIKETLNQIEIRLGRDRNDPNKSKKDRTADIDILNVSDTFDEEKFKRCEEPYVALCLSQNQTKADLSDQGLPAHQGPATVNWDRNAGKIVVSQNQL